MRVKDKVCVVTGGADGIGEATSGPSRGRRTRRGHRRSQTSRKQLATVAAGSTASR